MPTMIAQLTEQCQESACVLRGPKQVTATERVKRHFRRTSNIQRLQKIVSGFMSEGSDIKKTILRLHENDPTLTAFELRNAQSIKMLPPKARNAKFKSIVDALRTNTVVTSVVMTNINGTDYLAEQLADALTGNTSVKLLSLESNVIKHVGLVALGAMLKTNTTLEKIRLGNQAALVSTEGLHALVDAVHTSNRTLTACNLDLREKTPRHTLDKALLRNVDAQRLARLADKVDAPATLKVTATAAAITAAEPEARRDALGDICGAYVQQLGTAHLHVSSIDGATITGISSASTTTETTLSMASSTGSSETSTDAFATRARTQRRRTSAEMKHRQSRALPGNSLRLIEMFSG